MMNTMQSPKNDGVFYIYWHRKMCDMMLSEKVADNIAHIV